MEVVRTRQEAIVLMVEWWMEKSFEATLNQNNGDDSSTGGMVFMMMNQLSQKAQMEIAKEQKQLFKTKLIEIFSNDDKLHKLDVDYHPCDELDQAFEFAKINSGCAPVKTYTYINDKNQVCGHYQYGGKEFKI